MTSLRAAGFEFECYNPNIYRDRAMTQVTNAIQAMGFPAVNVGGYIGTDYASWQIKTDASLSPADRAFEVVSRTLPGTQAGIDEMVKVVNHLSSNGYTVNTSCGLHIHLDTRDLTAFEVACIAYRYNKRRAEINAILPSSRHASRWCNPLSGSSLDKVENVIRHENSTAVWGHSERYVAVNLEHAAKRIGSRRIEFRQHSGTLNAEKAVGWYKFLCNFVAETLKIIRDWKSANGPAASPAAIFSAPAPSHVAPIVRRQRRATGTRTVSEVVGTTTRIPHIEVGSDYDRFLNRLMANRVITQQDAREFGWPETRLRVTAHWLRRNGAELITTQRNGELAYVARGQADTLAAIFTAPAQIRRRVEVSSVAAQPVAAAPQAAPSATPLPGDLMNLLATREVLAGASDDVQAWYAARRRDLAGA